MPRHWTIARRGLSVVEVAIVGALALILIGVGLVALRLWWDTSARLRCMDNLRTVGESILAYQDGRKQLPASRIAREYATWAVQLAPYLPEKEAGPLLPWDLERTYYTQPPEVREAQLFHLYCPARRHPAQLSVEGDVPSTGKPDHQLYSGALGDYACCSGDGSTDWQGDAANGAIIPAKVLKQQDGRILEWRALTQLTDESLPRGLSETILLGEKHVPWEQFGRVAVGDGSLYNGDYAASFARVGGPGFGLAEDVYAPFNSQFGSAHPGVCHFLMADNSVRVFGVHMDAHVLGQLARRQ